MANMGMRKPKVGDILEMYRELPTNHVQCNGQPKGWEVVRVLEVAHDLVCTELVRDRRSKGWTPVKYFRPLTTRPA